MGKLCIIAPKLGEDVCFHPSCFQCSVCEELLVDLTYCVRDDVLYCERHYAEQIKPRCSACDEVGSFPAVTFLFFFELLCVNFYCVVSSVAISILFTDDRQAIIERSGIY